jgi:anti-sigma regulatory factor (Ser/Thr protein kinase)
MEVTRAAGGQAIVTVEDPSQAAEARRAAVAMAATLGFGETEAGRVALVTTEAATNLVKHGGGGIIALRSLQQGRVVGVEILALDRGPGIADLSRALSDGYSTAGSPGTGLGAIRRLSERFDIHSLPGLGTALVAEVWAAPRPAATGLEVGAVSAPCAGEDVCGDGWAVVSRPAGARLLVVDGLGHGPIAAEAARAAVGIFSRREGLAPLDLVEALHAGLRSTRGAAVAVGDVDLGRRRVRFSGLGNISACVVSGAGRRHLVSHNGTAGHQARKIDEFTYPWPPGGVLILHTDGVATHWDLDRYPGLLTRHPAIVAGVLFRDFNRGRDDATVVVAREAAA